MEREALLQALMAAGVPSEEEATALAHRAAARGVEAALAVFMRRFARHAQLLNTLNGTHNYAVPRGDVELARAFEVMQAAAPSLHITDWGIQVSRAGEAAAAMGRQGIGRAGGVWRQRLAPTSACRVVTLETRSPRRGGAEHDTGGGLPVDHGRHQQHEGG